METIGLFQQELLRIKQKLYPDDSHSAPSPLTGKIKMFDNGNARCIIEGTKENVFIHRTKLAGAMQDDFVKIESYQYNDKRYGRVLEIIERAHPYIVGQLKENMLVTPIDRKIPNQIKIENLSKAEEGNYVFVKLANGGDGCPYGNIVEVLGTHQTPFIDEKLITYQFQLPHKFPKEALIEAEHLPSNIPEEERRKRADLRRERIFTIDGEDSKDFDDAVSIKRLENDHYLLGVHIADVTSYVKEGSALDKEAYKRGFSVYFANQKVIPMLPKKLSENLCSLVPYKDRIALSCLLEFDRNGEVVSFNVFPSIIRSQARLTYKQVDDVLKSKNPNPTIINPHIVDDLKIMEELSSKLYENRLKNGSLNIDLPKPDFTFDDGNVIDVKKAEKNGAHRIIEEFMLSANKAVAEKIKGWPSVFRCQEAPEDEKIERLKRFLEMRGYILPENDPHTDQLKPE